MMVLSRRLVYVVLLVKIIRVSFLWRTLGIGLSPIRFVPMSGIIILSLAVGYVFVVWERVPFVSANLATAVVGVQANLPGVSAAVADKHALMVLHCAEQRNTEQHLGQGGVWAIGGVRHLDVLGPAGKQWCLSSWFRA